MGPITTVALYGLLDELSDASVHRSLSELSPVVDDPRYKRHILLGGDLNTGTQWRDGEAFYKRDRNVLDRIDALGEIGVLSILHTWGQTLMRHPHVHCVVLAGGLAPDHQRWIHPTYAGFFLPVPILREVFRGKYVQALRRAYDRDELDLAGGSEHLRVSGPWRALVALFDTEWVVFAKPALGGAPAVVRYLGRYTHRVAISNHRLLAFDGKHVTFSYKDYARGNQRRTMTLPAMEFLRRFRPTHSPARFRADPPVRIPREHLPGRSRGPCADHPRHTLAVDAGHRHDRAYDHRHAGPRDVGVSAGRRRDDRRADPLGAPPRDPYLEFR